MEFLSDIPLTYYILIFLIGIFGGVMAGLLGVGGGLIFTPVLIFLFADSVQDPVIWIIATSLLCTFAASLSSIRKHIAMQNFHLRESLMVGLSSIGGTWAGKQVVTSSFYSETEFILLFSLILLYTAWRFAFSRPVSSNGSGDKEGHAENIRLKGLQAILIGSIGGFWAVLAGVGGGIIMVPALVMLVGLPYRTSISISSAAIVFISFFGWMQFAIETPSGPGLTSLTLGYVDAGLALPLIAGALIGANSGVYAASVIPRRTIELSFSVITLVVAARLLWGLM